MSQLSTRHGYRTDAQLASIHKLLNPRSIAVVGATPRLRYGGRMLAAALRANRRVKVYSANLADKLAEMDINPLMVLPVRQGVTAADALVVF